MLARSLALSIFSLALVAATANAQNTCDMKQVVLPQPDGHGEGLEWVIGFPGEAPFRASKLPGQDDTDTTATFRNADIGKPLCVGNEDLMMFEVYNPSLGGQRGHLWILARGAKAVNLQIATSGLVPISDSSSVAFRNVAGLFMGEGRLGLIAKVGLGGPNSAPPVEQLFEVKLSFNGAHVVPLAVVGRLDREGSASTSISHVCFVDGAALYSVVPGSGIADTFRVAVGGAVTRDTHYGDDAPNPCAGNSTSGKSESSHR